MKKLPLSLLILFAALSLGAQDLQKLATKGAVRLFADKDDLASVIQILPEGTVVEAISADTLFTLVRYSNTEGYIKSDRLTAALPVVVTTPADKPAAGPGRHGDLPELTDKSAGQPGRTTQYTQQPTERFQALIDKYGADMARRLYQHKVWKGISAEMARDSWGEPLKVNRRSSGSGMVEEWVYSKTILYFRGGVLTDWGPAGER